MTFLHPQFLYFMLPPIIIFFYFILTQQEKQFSFFSDDMLKKLRQVEDTLTLKTRNVLFFVATVFILIALAQPVIEEGKVKVESKSADIMIALDISDSMLAQDIVPNRLKSAKQKILDLLAESPNERLGVIGFANDAYLVAPLSFDHKALNFLLRQLKPAYITEKGTDFEQLIVSASEMLSKNEQKYLLILTDGGDQESFSKEIELAKQNGMKIFVLGVGTKKGAPIKKQDGQYSDYIKYNGKIIVSKLNDNIKELATQTGGAYIESVSSSADIKAMLHEIESRSVKKSLKEDEITQYIQLFIYPLIVAVILFLIATSSMYKRVKKSTAAAAFIMITFIAPQKIEASLLDFQLLQNAKEAYENKEYSKSAALYSDYALRHSDQDALYDYANALYKDKKFKEAEAIYKKVIPKDKVQQFNIKHNLGNSLAKQGIAQSDKELLKKAITSYEEALKNSQNKLTQENLEAVKKALKEQEEKEKQQQQKSKDNKDQQNQKDKKDQNKQQQQNSDKKNKDTKDQKKNQKSDKQKSDEKDKNQQQKDKKESADEKKKEQQKEKEQKQKQSADEQKKKEQEEKEKKQKAEKKSQKDEKKSEQERQAQDLQEANPQQMSERESKKWLQKIQKNRPGMMYKLKSIPTQQKENSNAKPW